MTIIQDPNECMIDTMPTAAKALTEIDYTLKIDEVIKLFAEIHKIYK